MAGRTRSARFFLTNRFFWIGGGVIACFALSFPFDALFPLALVVFVAWAALTLADAFLLFFRHPGILAFRRLTQVLSLGDEHGIEIKVENSGSMRVRLTLIDEIPVQFQKRDFSFELSLNPGEQHTAVYHLTPLVRGAYLFQNLNVFVRTMLGLVERRLIFAQNQEVAVYPSIIQMKKYELRATQQIAHETGIKKMRRIGHSYEFEQIKNYVEGDDIRSINWKASGRQASLMVNQYEDERSQQVYCVIDKSRSMRMPFEGLSLMDYAINTSLALSNIILKKKDKAGLLTFSDVIGSTLKAARDTGQLRRILESLYREKERPLEANYELLYQAVRRLINVRSLLILFVNFESRYALERVLPVLRKLNKAHLLVVVFFENTEIRRLAQEQVDTTEDIYRQTVARHFLQEKREMLYMLRQFGIQAVLTKPQDLTLHTINKYLELKSRGLI